MSLKKCTKTSFVKKMLMKMSKKRLNDGIKLNSKSALIKGNDEASNLQDLARKMAQRNYHLEDNPAVKRLKERFKRI